MQDMLTVQNGSVRTNQMILPQRMQMETRVLKAITRAQIVEIPEPAANQGGDVF